jgi:Domain of unknown function (DUF2017)
VATRFVRKKHLISARFTADEATLIANLVAQVIELLRDDENTRSGSADDDLADLVGAFGSSVAPSDPVVARLLPDGYRGDDEAAGEFRRFTEVGLRSGKVDAAQRVLDDLGDTELADRVTVSLDPEAALIWARCLNDLRLSIGTRLEVTEDDEQRFGALDDDDPVRWTYDVYVWLGWLQESLIEAMSESLPEPHRE